MVGCRVVAFAVRGTMRSPRLIECPFGVMAASRAPALSAYGQAVYVELYRRIERVADRLCEGEEAVLHVMGVQIAA